MLACELNVVIGIRAAISKGNDVINSRVQTTEAPSTMLVFPFIVFIYYAAAYLTTHMVTRCYIAPLYTTQTTIVRPLSNGFTTFLGIAMFCFSPCV